MKKNIYIIIFLLSLFLINTNVSVVQAEDIYGPTLPDSSDEVGPEAPELPSVSLADNDYEIVCIYDDGASLTITRDEVYLVNTTNSLDSNANSNISFYLTNSQTNDKDDSGKVTTSRADNLLTGGRCPSKLYLYKVESNDDDNVDEDAQLDNVFNYYYSTKDGIASSIAGTHHTFLWWGSSSNAEQLSQTANLVSEEANLITKKQAKICDYQIDTGDGTGSKNVSIYVYGNLAFLEQGIRVTPLKESVSADECPAKGADNRLYLNNPTPRMVGGAYSGNYQYDSIRYYYAVDDSSSCESSNNNNACEKYKFVGERTGQPENKDEVDVCELLGNDTISTLGDIFSVLQIIVPAIVIILTAIDITKMVLAGNLNEELPKKKKIIYVRMIVMFLFFFSKIIAGLIIKLLIEANVNIGDIECFFN